MDKLLFLFFILLLCSFVKSDSLELESETNPTVEILDSCQPPTDHIELEPETSPTKKSWSAETQKNHKEYLRITQDPTVNFVVLTTSNSQHVPMQLEKLLTEKGYTWKEVQIDEDLRDHTRRATGQYTLTFPHYFFNGASWTSNSERIMTFLQRTDIDHQQYAKAL